MGLETAIAVDGRIPLFVDVDGTLVRGDISLESFLRIARSGFCAFLMVLVWLSRGRAIAKARAARRDPVVPGRLRYRTEVLDEIAAARQADRPVILASASHWRNIVRIARHLGLDEAVIATRGRANLKGRAKLAAIRARLGIAGVFDYIGDNRVDTAIWRQARDAMSVGYVPAGSAVRSLAPAMSRGRALAKAARPHQWAKNALVLVPALTSGQFGHLPVLLKAVAAAGCMSLIASSIYLLNDLLDVDVDRAHRSKWKRPIAHGDLPIPLAIVAALGLASAGLMGGWLLGGAPVTGWLVAYMVITTAYSLRLKSVMVGDVIVLASLYTIRIWIGGVAIGVPLSFWLMLFSIFLFLSLAYLKRYIEMRDAVEPARLIEGRGYVGGDLDVVMISGVASGIVSVLVLALFAHDQDRTHYAEPELLGLLCLPLMYWLNRIWMMARRGEVEGDPVAFAIKDRRSALIGATMIIIFFFALMGLPEYI